MSTSVIGVVLVPASSHPWSTTTNDVQRLQAAAERTALG
jgi:hypothetical protein